MAESGDLVEITINHMGVDVAAIVTLEEASLLLNDETAATKYVEALVAQQTPSLEVSQCSIPIDKFNSKEATLSFLALRKKYNDKFNDRKTQKNILWQKIAAEMKSNGCDIPDGREGAEKCRQKFANLQRTYINYIKHMKTTGSEKRDPPLYYDEMNEILGSKDKVNPPYLEDSLDTGSSDTNNEPSCSNSASSFENDHSSGSSSIMNKQKEIKNRFNHSNSVRPTNNFNKIIDLFKEQHEELRQDKKKHMQIFENAINMQNAQRERFLDILQKSKNRKRRRSSSSSDD